MDIRTRFGQETLYDVMKVVNENKSAIKLLQETQFEELRPYWDIETWVVESMDKIYDGNLVEEYQMYKAMNGATADIYKNCDLKRKEALNKIKSNTDAMREAYLIGNLIDKNDGTYEPNPHNVSSDEYKLIQVEAAEIEKLLIEWDLKTVGAFKNQLNKAWAKQHVDKFR